MSLADLAPNRSSDELPLHDLLRALRRRVPIILAITVVITSAVLTLSLRAEKQYTATAKLLFRDPGFDEKLFGSSILAPSKDPDREAATNLGLVSLDTITKRTAAELAVPGLTRNKIRDKVNVTSEGRSDVVAIAATDPSRAFAAKLANTIGQQYIDFRRSADRSKITNATALVRRQLDALSPAQQNGPDGRSVKTRIEQLEILASLQTGNAELVQPAQSPRSASSPKTARNTIVAALLGLILSALLAVLLGRIDRRLRDRSDAERIFERPVLGSIPESRGLRKTNQGTLSLAGAEGEAFRALRTNLRYFAIDQDVKSMLVTSSAPADGKSTIARHLAATAAASNVRAVLLEADLRRPALGRAISNLGSRGLTDVLAGAVELDEVVQRIPLSLAGQRGRAEQHMEGSLDVITAGPIPPNPTDLLESDRMLDVIAELETRYDFVIIDSSPLTVVPDAIPIARRVSGVVVVVRIGKSTTTSARHLHKQLDNLGITPLGIVINSTSPREDYGYYGYGAYDSPAEADGEVSTNGPESPRWPGRRRRQEETVDRQPSA